ncbi:MAG TPA: DUF2059 domain-containing protein [Vicinamibacteria bacterium]|nr:DUF2059 domain-containing protein [Vicinamibacteria bacterium]
MARVWALLAAALLTAAPATGDEVNRRALALELARLMLDEPARRGLDEQVGLAMVRSIGATLQQRLNRNLQASEWRLVSDAVSRFITETLPPSRLAEIGAEVYAGHFSEGELAELVRFQRSDVGRKAARLTPVIGAETAQAVDTEIRESQAMPRLLAELQAAFPVLRSESP